MGKIVFDRTRVIQIAMTLEKIRKGMNPCIDEENYDRIVELRDELLEKAHVPDIRTVKDMVPYL